MTETEIKQKIEALKNEKVELTEVFMTKLGEAMAVFHLISKKEDAAISISRKHHPAPWNAIQATKYYTALESGISGRSRIDVEISKLNKDLLRLNR